MRRFASYLRDRNGRDADYLDAPPLAYSRMPLTKSLCSAADTLDAYKMRHTVLASTMKYAVLYHLQAKATAHRVDDACDYRTDACCSTDCGGDLITCRRQTIATDATSSARAVHAVHAVLTGAD